MGQSSSRIEPVQHANTSTSRTCPVSHESPAASSPAKCPVDHQSAAAKPAQCPVDHGSSSPKSAGYPVDHSPINPLNQMPDLPQQRQSNQSTDLPLERSESSIPRDNSSKWEYPSPQQFYNALVRKGWETPETHVVTMVEIHNFLNEEAWEEVKKWEKRRTEYVPDHMAKKHCSHLPVMMIFNLPALKVDQVRRHQKRGYTSLQAGCCPRALGLFNHFLRGDMTLTKPNPQALSLLSIGTTGLFVVQSQAKKSDISSIIIQLPLSLMAHLSFLSMFDQPWMTSVV